MLIDHFQKQKVSVEYLKFKFNLDDSKKNINDINFLLEKYGIKIKTYQSEIADLLLALNNSPLIALVSNSQGQKHFIILYKKVGDRLIVADPNDFKIKTISISEFAKSYLQIVSIPKRVAKAQKPEFNFFSNFRILKDNIFFIMFITFFGLATDFLIIMSNTFLKNFLVLVDTNLKSEIITIFVGFAIIFLIFLSISFCQTILIRNVFMKICKNEQLKVINQFLSIKYETFKSINHVKWYQIFGEIHLKNEIVIIRFFKYFNAMIIMIVCLVLLERINIYFFTFVLIENFIIFFLGRISYLTKKDLHYKMKNAENKYQNDLKETVDGFLNTKTRSNGGQQQAKIMQSYQENLNNNKRIGIIANNIDAIEYITNKFFYLLIFYLATYLITKKDLNANQLIYYSVLALQIKKFFSSVHAFIDDTLTLKIINENLLFLNFRTSDDKKKTKKIADVEKITIADFSKFINNQVAITNLSADFYHHTFLTGKNGSGKTTILLTLAGIYDNFIGKITYDDLKISEVKDFSQICYLGNNDFIGQTEVKEFITKDWKIKPDMSNDVEMVLSILAKSQINLLQIIKGNGANLSVGQKQIINFVAIIFTDYQVYLLDESLCNVETGIKNELLTLFLKIHHQKLIVFCDHDSSSESFFDRRVEI